MRESERAADRAPCHSVQRFVRRSEVSHAASPRASNSSMAAELAAPVMLIDLMVWQR